MTEPTGQYIGPVARIQAAVADAYGISVDKIRGQRRQKNIVEARHVAMYLASEATGQSLPALGRLFGGRDHSGVLRALEKIQERIEEDPFFAAHVADLRAAVAPAADAEKVAEAIGGAVGKIVDEIRRQAQRDGPAFLAAVARALDDVRGK